MYIHFVAGIPFLFNDTLNLVDATLYDLNKYKIIYLAKKGTKTKIYNKKQIKVLALTYANDSPC